MTDVLNMTFIKGIQPVSTLDGSGKYTVRQHPKNSAATGQAARVAVGDPVRLNADGSVQTMLATESDDGVFYGVACGIKKANGAPKSTFGQSSAISLSAETTDLIDVAVGTDIIYRVATQLSAMPTATAQALVGSNASIAFASAGAYENTNGVSTAYAVPAEASASSVFKVVGISNRVDEEGQNQFFEVILNNGVLKAGTAGV